MTYEEVSKIFRTDAVKIINLGTKLVWKLPTSTQLRATWHTDSLDMVVLPCTRASRYHNWCIDGDTSPEYFGYYLVQTVFCYALYNLQNKLKSFPMLFRKIAKSNYKFCHICPSSCPHGTLLLVDGFSWNFIFEHFSKICLEN
jgi:hypothetical protein